MRRRVKMARQSAEKGGKRGRRRCRRTLGRTGEKEKRERVLANGEVGCFSRFQFIIFSRKTVVVKTYRSERR